MSVWSSLSELAERLASDITAINNRLKYIENNLYFLTSEINKEYIDLIPNSKYFKTVKFKRLDGTLLREETLTEDPSNPSQVPVVYDIKTVSIYDKTGLNTLKTIKYKLVYDSDGNIISETVTN